MRPPQRPFLLRKGRVGPEVAPQRRRTPAGPTAAGPPPQATFDSLRFERLAALRRILRQGAYY